MMQEGILKPDMNKSVIEDDDNSDEEFSKFLFATKENLSRLTLNSSVFEDEDNSDEEFSKFLAATKENLSRLTLNSKLNSFSAKARMNVLEKQRSASASLSANEESPKCLQNLTNRKCKSTSESRSRNILGEEIESLPFMKNRTVYAQKLFEFFNEKVFENQLPKDMPLLWNNNLKTTAGTTVCLKESGQYKCKINLSSKILTSYDRLQDTLLHEMCHAAVWIINKINNVCHGPLWQIWAARCNWILPHIEVPQRCHNYEISFPYFYKCVKCDWKCGRYKRSQKLSRALCPKCRNQLSLTVS